MRHGRLPCYQNRLLLLLLSPDAGWPLSLYPAAGEAVRAPRMYSPSGFAADPARARAEAARRARSKVRRSTAANLLDRFGTLTYAGARCHDPGQARADVAAFMRGLRAELGGKPFPYVGARVAPLWPWSACPFHGQSVCAAFVDRGRLGPWVHIDQTDYGETAWCAGRRGARIATLSL